MGASVFVAKRGGTIVTCAATSGYMIEYDNRHLWMKLKTIKGSHFSNYREAWAANQTIIDGARRSAAFGGLSPRRDGRGGRSRCNTTATRERSASSAWRRARGSASATPRLRAAVGEERLTIFRRHDEELSWTSLLTEIDHVAIAVNDLEAAIAWYADVFGATWSIERSSSPMAWKKPWCAWPTRTFSC